MLQFCTQPKNVAGMFGGGGERDISNGFFKKYFHSTSTYKWYNIITEKNICNSIDHIPIVNE